jgi:hypothetical protein
MSVHISFSPGRQWFLPGRHGLANLGERQHPDKRRQVVCPSPTWCPRGALLGLERDREGYTVNIENTLPE